MRCRSSESSGSGQTIVSEFECVLVCVCAGSSCPFDDFATVVLLQEKAQHEAEAQALQKAQAAVRQWYPSQSSHFFGVWAYGKAEEVARVAAEALHSVVHS